ncbi:MAG: SDR family oxidoreductase [Puniceicoccales bacterium]|jgi:UDP-glucuronate decarboxylase|nr:SDR family oxidoreductase [Puniceicoccales bacterium]
MAVVLVAGGGGFLGSYLCRALLRAGNVVLCLDNYSTGREDNVRDLFARSNFYRIDADITGPISVNGKVDQIYNLACPASPAAYGGREAVSTTKTCVLGALNLLELAKAHRATILQASTSEVYGDPTVHPQPESYRGNVNCTGPRACYDEGKRCAESLFFDYHRNEGIAIRVVRIFNTYGPRMGVTDGRVVSNFICQALEGDDVTIYGDGSQTRSLCYVDDCIDFLLRAMNAEQDFTGPVNCGNPGEITVEQLARTIVEKTGSRSRIVHRPLPVDDPRRRCPDISLAREHFGWTPRVSLGDGLATTIDYFRVILGLWKIGPDGILEPVRR